jgi:hypothetical protein
MDELEDRIRPAFERQFRNLAFPEKAGRQLILTAQQSEDDRHGLGWLAGTVGVLLLALVVGIFVFGSRLHRQQFAPAASAVPSLAASASVAPTATACQPTRVAGCMTATPAQGPVGTVVTIEGTGCNNPGQTAYLVFVGNGAADFPDVPVDANGHFSIQLTVPASYHSLQGQGGGAVTPGQYSFGSQPPACVARFTVTP